MAELQKDGHFGGSVFFIFGGVEALLLDTDGYVWVTGIVKMGEEDG
jgi:hypothetical protein